MSIGSKFLANLESTIDAELIWESIDSRPFGNSEACIRVGNIYFWIDTDRDDLNVKLSIKDCINTSINLYYILWVLRVKDLRDRDSLTLEQTVKIVESHYVCILELISTEEGRRMTQDVGKYANELWMRSVRERSEENRRRKNKPN